MKRANHLVIQIAQMENLREAFLRASRGKRGKREVVAFSRELNVNLAALSRGILDGTVAVGDFHSFTIRDPKERIIHAAAFPERVLHHAIINVCEPVFERVAIDDSYACRKGKGREAALARAQSYARGNGWYLQMDVRKYFDSIDHAVLKRALRRKFKDAALLRLFDRIIDSYSTAPCRGLPIGSLTSQHFANFFLDALDRFVKETLRLPYVRYMDDLVCWADDKATLREARQRITSFADEFLGLEMKVDLKLNRTTGGVNFLGYRVLPDRLRLNQRSAQRFRLRLRKLEQSLSLGELSELDFQQRSTSLCAFAAKARTWKFRQQCLSGGDQRAPTALTAAAVGTTTRRTAAPPIATGTTQATATTTSASASSIAQSVRVDARMH